MKSKLTAFVFVAALFAIAVSGAFAPQKSVSAIENRELAPPPVFSAKAAVSGRFMEDLENYLLDRFPLRDAWVGLAGTADVAFGRTDNGRVYFGDDDWLFSTDAIDFKQLDANLNRIRDFVADVSREYPRVTFSALPAPASWNVAGDRLPAFAPADDESEAMRRIRAALDGFALVCDPTEALSEAYRAGTPVYYRTDHHWTARGAYVAYRAWAERYGLTASPASDFDISAVSEEFYGTNASKAGLPWTKPDRLEVFVRRGAPRVRMTVETGEAGDDALRVSDSLYDAAFLATRDKYAYFLGGNNPVVTIDTGAENGRTLLIVKDSFAHCFAPFLTAHFERVILADPRYLRNGFGRFFRENDITDVLFLYGATQLANDRNLFYLQL
jgi:hypothetical protein